MADIRLKKISVENSPLIIQHGNISLTNTNASDSILTGALISNGGISINCTYDATSSSSGGAFTVGGGISTMKNLYIGESLILDSLNSTIQVNGVSENRLFLDNVTNKKFYISLDGIYKSFELTEEGIYLNNDTPSENFTTGALRILGGVTINSTEESSSITCGSGLTVYGGSSIVKKLFVGGGIESNNSSNTIGNLYTTTNGNLGIGVSNPSTNLSITTNTLGSKITLWDGNVSNKHFGFGVTDNQLNYDVSNVNDDHVFFSNSKNGSGTELVRIKGTGNVGINTTNPEYKLDVDGTARFSESITTGSIYNTNQTTTNIVTTNISSGTLNLSGNLYSSTTSIENTVNNYTGSSGSINILGDVVVAGKEILFTNTGVNEPSMNGRSNGTKIVLYPATNETTGDYSIGIENRNMWLQAATESDGFKFYQGTTANFVISTGGNIGIGTTNPQNKLDIIGDVKISDTITTSSLMVTSSLMAIGNSHTIGPLIITNGNLGIGTTEPNRKLTVNGDTIITGDTIIEGDITFDSFYIVSGKIGINNTSPVNNLDINTDTRITNVLTIEQQTASENFTTGALIVKNGGISINCTEESIGYTSGGALSIAGGVSINKKLNVNGNTTINGILRIENTTESNTIGNSGSIEILGGVAINKNLNIGQIITCDKLKVFNNEASLNGSTGSIITNGGITINSNEQSTSSTNGGGLTILGGIGIKKNMYIDGNEFKRGISNYYSEANNFIQIYNSSDEKIYSLDRDYFTNNFSLSRYNAGSFIEKTFEIAQTDGKLTFNNTTNSTSSSAASIIIKGGVTLNSTQNSLNSTVGGALSVYGGQSIAKNLNIGGSLIIDSTEQSTNVSTGVVLVSGGVGITKNLNVGGNTTINGDLYVLGVTNSLDTNNVVFNDNLIILNSAPSGLRDSGFVITRYQLDNDSGSGDIVNENVYISFQIPSQSGMANTEIKLSNSASAINDYYKDWWIKITSGFSNNQVRKITGYNGSTKVATLSSSWTTQNPAENDIVFLYNRNYVGLIYNETDDIFVFGSTLADPGNTSVSLTDNIKVKTGELIVSNTTGSSNSSTGSVVITGGVSINSTENALNNTVGGSLTVNGGTSIKKKLYVGEELYVNNINFTPNTGDSWKSSTFSANNNQSSQALITGLDLDSNIWGFDIFLTARLNADTDLYTNYHLRGVNKIDSWEIVKTYVGDDMGIEFYITNEGEIEYTSPNFTNFISLTFKWRMFVN